MDDTHVLKCVGCGTEHGSVGGEINCLRSTVHLLRGQLQGARNVIEAMRSSAKQYYALPRTKGGHYDDMANADKKKNSR